MFGLFGMVFLFGIVIVFVCIYVFGKNLLLFDEKMKWIKFGDFIVVDKRWFFIYYEFGIDGLLFVMMVLMVFLVMFVVIVVFFIKRNLKVFYMLLFMLEIGMFGVFVV